MKRTNQKIKEFTSLSLDAFRKDVDDALKAVAKKRGMKSLKCGHITYSTFSCTIKVEAVIGSTKATKSQSARLATLCDMYGLPSDAIGKKFTRNGMEHTIVTIKTANRRYPVITQVTGGSSYKLSTEVVKNGLNYSPVI